MPRSARVVIPGLAHHITQRGNRRQQTFFCDSDYELYQRILAEEASRGGLGIASYCLIFNHVHLNAIPAREDTFARVLGTVHRRYTAFVNAREGWKGHLWQGRFYSCPMDERHTVAGSRYTEWNPCRAGLTARPEDWPFSSARAHLGIARDLVLDACGVELPGVDWRELLANDVPSADATSLRKHALNGRPLGDARWVRELEARTGRILTARRRGPPSGRTLRAA